MAIVVEDGSADPTAVSYLSVEDADTHHRARGNTRWDNFPNPEKEAALVRASDYIDMRFGSKFIGFKQRHDQGLEWPRYDAEDRSGWLIGTTEVPTAIKKACAEYALRAAIIGNLAPDPLLPVPEQSMEAEAGERDTNVVTGEVIRISQKVGPIEETTTYQTAAQSARRAARSVQSSLVNDFHIPEYPQADMWIESLLRSSEHVGRLVRGD